MRCMIKIDLRKTYDSIEWPFVDDMLVALVPVIVIKWIMECLSTVSYSVVINAKPTKSFQLGKG